MADNCCNLVGNFDIDPELGIISVTSQGSTDVGLITAGGEYQSIIGPSTGTVSITAFANSNKYYGCPGRAGVSVPWITKNDCTNPIFLYGGAGRSYISGGYPSYVDFPSIKGVVNPVNTYNVVSASASSGPAALYEDSTQRDGFGLLYDGRPWSIDTSEEAKCTINLSSYGIGSDFTDCKLQNINVQFVPGQIPVVNMSFIYVIEN